SLVQAGVNTLYPYSSTPLTGGKNETIQIGDDGQPPPLNTLTAISCDLYIGNSQSQTLVKNIASGLDGAKTTQIPFFVDPTMGPSASCYFIKYTSGSNIFYSGTFAINGLSGSIPGFNPSVCNANTTSNSTTASPSAAPSAVVAATTPSAPASTAPASAAPASPSQASASKPSSPPSNASSAPKSNSSPTSTGSIKTPTPSSSSGDFNHPISNFAGLSLVIVAVAFTLL
ncbi:21097_t:CDS:2, partial [Gigaspora rosea]